MAEASTKEKVTQDRQYEYWYSGYTAFVKSIFGYSGSLIVIGLIILIVIEAIWHSNNMTFPQDYLKMLLVVGFFTLWTALGSSFWPNVVVDADGLSVEFFWRTLRVPWNKVVDIKTISIFPLPKFWLVRTRGLTPLHRLFSLYAGSILPGFLISSQLMGCKELLSAISHRSVPRQRDRTAE